VTKTECRAGSWRLQELHQASRLPSHLMPTSLRSSYDPLQKWEEAPVAREQRKLAAIFAADVVGYSRLMGRDESGTLARLREHRKERLELLECANIDEYRLKGCRTQKSTRRPAAPAHCRPRRGPEHTATRLVWCATL
jgi:hypothetical protein